METFEKKVSEIFSENPRLAGKIPVVIRKMFQESEAEFKRRIRKEPEDQQQLSISKLFDILYIDFVFESLNDRFLNWVIEKYPDRFNESELDEMRAQSVSHLDYYEVQKVLPGKGCYIKSIFTQNEVFLKDVSSSSSLVKWDIFLSRCYRFRGDYYATGSLTLFGQNDKKFIVNRIRQALSDERDVSQNSRYPEFAKNHWDIFYKIEREIRERVMDKKYYTKYGELNFCEVRFHVQDLQSILETIKTCEEFNFIETKLRRVSKKKGYINRYQFDWFSLSIEEELKSIETGNIEDGFMMTTSQLDTNGNQLGIEVIGSLFIDQFLCRLETRSLELAEFAVCHFAQVFGDAITFKRIIKKKIDISQERKTMKQPSEPVQSSQSQPEFIKGIREKYYLDLLDEKIPQLKNMSPREARQDPLLYPLLIEWLKGLENMLERSRQRGEEYISINIIKKELNIDW